jgi:hypothetical protein
MNLTKTGTINLQNPAISDIYTEHSCGVNVAKYSPSGFYIASGGKNNSLNQRHNLPQLKTYNSFS